MGTMLYVLNWWILMGITLQVYLTLLIFLPGDVSKLMDTDGNYYACSSYNLLFCLLHMIFYLLLPELLYSKVAKNAYLHLLLATDSFTAGNWFKCPSLHIYGFLGLVIPGNIFLTSGTCHDSTSTYHRIINFSNNWRTSVVLLLLFQTIPAVQGAPRLDQQELVSICLMETSYRASCFPNHNGVAYALCSKDSVYTPDETHSIYKPFTFGGFVPWRLYFIIGQEIYGCCILFSWFVFLESTLSSISYLYHTNLHVFYYLLHVCMFYSLFYYMVPPAFYSSFWASCCIYTSYLSSWYSCCRLS